MIHQPIRRIVDQKVAASAYEAVQDDARELAVQSDRLRADRLPNDAARARTENYVRDLRDRIATAARAQDADEADFLEAVRQGLQRASGGRSVVFANPAPAVFQPVDAEDRRLQDELADARAFQIKAAERAALARKRAAVMAEALVNADAAVAVAQRVLDAYRASKAAA